VLLAGLTALFMAVGYLLGGGAGAVIAFFIAAAMNASFTGVPTGWCY